MIENRRPEIVVVNAVVIRDGRLLLARKKYNFYWRFIGGRIDGIEEEIDVHVLNEVIRKGKLSDSEAVSLREYHRCTGITKTMRKHFLAVSCLVNLEGCLSPGPDVQEVSFFERPERMPFLIPTCYEVIAKLREDGLLPREP